MKKLVFYTDSVLDLTLILSLQVIKLEESKCSGQNTYLGYLEISELVI